MTARRDDGEQLIDERGRVARRGPARARVPDCASSARRFPSARKSASRNVQRSSHCEMRDVDRDRPGGGPEDEEPRDREHVDELDRLQPQRVGGLDGEERDQAGERRPDRAPPRAPSATSVKAAASPSAARAESSPRAIGRDRLTGCSRSAATSLTSFTRYAALDAAQYATNGENRREPPAGVAELRREDDPREEEEVLRPLAGPERDEGGAGRRAPPRQLDDGRVRRLGHRETLCPFARRGLAPRCAAPTLRQGRP